MSDTPSIANNSKLDIAIPSLTDLDWKLQRKRQDIVRTALGTNVLPPVNCTLAAGGKLLDIGSGRCFWLYEVAEEFGNCRCVGIDIRTVPARERRNNITNVELHDADVVEGGLPFEDDSFDLVSMRHMANFLTVEELSRLLDEIIRVLKPGGWVQLIEAGRMTRVGPHFDRLSQKLDQALGRSRTNADLIENLEQHAQTAGFSPATIKKKIVHIPIGWGGELGNMMLDITMDKFVVAKPVMIHSGDTSMELDRLSKAVRAESAMTRCYSDMYIITAAKPLSNDEGQGAEM